MLPCVIQYYLRAHGYKYFGEAFCFHLRLTQNAQGQSNMQL